jgi:hypothetical protein
VKAIILLWGMLLCACNCSLDVYDAVCPVKESLRMAVKNLDDLQAAPFSDLGSSDSAFIAQDPKLSYITGAVIELMSKEPIEGVDVSIEGREGGTVTDRYGRFHLPNVGPGIVRVITAHPLLRTARTDIRCLAGEGISPVISMFSAQEPLIADGLIAYYPLDGSGVDVSGNGFHSTPKGVVKFEHDRHGNPSAAARFSGFIDRLVVPHHERFNALPLTMAFWIRTDGKIHPDAMIVGKFMQGTGEGYEFFTDDMFLCTASMRANFAQHARVNASDPNTTNWTHIVCVFSTLKTELYLNGKLAKGTLWFGTPSPTKTTAPFLMGCGESNYIPDGELQGLNGWLDEVYVFDRVLTFQEIQLLAK